ncbi:hypothetical protein EXT42_06560 [Pseudoalteromonas sp. CO302Y]|uniref:hypothetical protein n=1 Tax=unclassified Pseudoalteromonas TaxID=194690 RepID=UPI001022E6E3|nr:hypothetical protein EXT42_06560 [Pseudoalteromonas sp. CO302Y]RZG10446.1 hypothetical protein EXT40_06570 [Pseudoalteromonas sp. CO133X]
MRYIILITAIVLSAGCASSANTYNPEEMADLASQLKDISAAVDGTLKFSSESYTDPQKLLLTAIRGDKSRLTPFKNYQLKVVIQEQNAALLLCQDERLLIEDAGCTAKSDIQHWQSSTPLACEATVTFSQLCASH